MRFPSSDVLLPPSPPDATLRAAVPKRKPQTWTVVLGMPSSQDPGTWTLGPGCAAGWRRPACLARAERGVDDQVEGQHI